MFGNGSDGPLNVLSGTHNLPLNVKHQFTTVNVAAGAVLSTNSPTGAVLYITARESITIDGIIDLKNKVNRGNNSWSVEIDGVSYSSPGVAPGTAYAGPGQNGSGFGAGGAGIGLSQAPGGGSSQGGANPSGGNGPYHQRTTNGETYISGSPGSQSGGGGGSVRTKIDNFGDPLISGIQVANGGDGASSHGGNGGDGFTQFTNTSVNSGTSPTRGGYAGGGGGGGGLAGRAGVHVVLRAPVVILNGQIITAGTNGGNGGNGGRSSSNGVFTSTWGDAGLGGGGGSGGNVVVTYAQNLVNSGTQDRTRGVGGAAGFGGSGFTQPSNVGSSGSTGIYSASQITDPALYASELAGVSIASSESVDGGTLLPQAVNLTSVSISGIQAFGDVKITFAISQPSSVTSSELLSDDAVFTQSPPPPPPPTDWEAIGKEDSKVYVYRVYQSDGTFLGIWTDVEDDLMFTQAINTPGATTTVRLARSPNTTKEVRAQLTTEAGEALTTQDLNYFAVTFQTNNSVGDGTDVDINLKVDVWVHYGEFDNLTTQIGEFLTTEDGDYIMAAGGSPNGKRVFSGFILDYESLYGAKTGVTVTLASHGAELSNELIRDGETIVISYPTDEIATTVKDILDTNPGTIGYSIDSIETTGVSAPATFQLNTKLEGIESLFSQTPDGFYWFGDVADNVLVMKSRSETADHRFRLGTHIKSMALKRSQEQLRNRVYFVGEEDESGVSILKKYEDTVSQADWRVGLHRITDRRFSVPASMERRAGKDISRYKDPVFTTTVTISSARYDLESIKLGQMVAFENVNNFLQELLLQIVSLSYTPRAVTLQLGEVLDTQAQLIEGVNSSLQNEQFQRLPNTPS